VFDALFAMRRSLNDHGIKKIQDRRGTGRQP
jgi:hypothetical protein